MALRIHKRWEQLGRPDTAGDHDIQGIGEVEVLEEHLQLAQELGGNPVAVLGHHPDSGFIAKWEILELRAE